MKKLNSVLKEYIFIKTITDKCYLLWNNEENKYIVSMIYYKKLNYELILK